MRRLTLVLSLSLQAGCGTTIFGVRVPLAESGQAASTDTGAVIIEDQRPASERKTHTGGGLARCERWYGDDTYIPSKLVYLERLLAERVAGAAVRVRLQRFDTVEYCDNTANRAAAAAAAGASGASGNPLFIPARNIAGGDSVLVRLAGDINGATFDISQRFNYSDLSYGWSELPAANPAYHERMRLALAVIADEIAAQGLSSGR